MISRFSKQIPLSNRSMRLLPAYHTCDGYSARSHVERLTIETTDVCDVFGEKITYLFYGRPAFKYDVGNESTTDLALYPICFVLDLENIGPLKRIFPFDTGAWVGKLLDKYFHAKISHLDFEIEPDTKRINDIVFHIFGSTKNYLTPAIGERQFPAEDFETISYSKMIESHVRSTADERRITIEIQAPDLVRLTQQTVKGLILPTQLRKSKLFDEFISANSVRAQCYDVEVWNPALSFSQVSAAAKRLTRALGYSK